MKARIQTQRSAEAACGLATDQEGEGTPACKILILDTKNHPTECSMIVLAAKATSYKELDPGT